MPDNAAIAPDVARAAAHWLTLMHSGEASAQDKIDCDHWRAADPEHERAWRRAETLQHQLGLLPTELGMAALNRRGEERRKVLKILSLLIAAPTAAYLLHSQPRWTSDYHTATGERKQVTLADGTRLALNTDSLVDIRFSAEQRLIRLRQGEILVDSGTDPDYSARHHRPLRVITAQGHLEALGTRFSVKSLERDIITHLSVFEGAVRITPANGDTLVVQGGQQARFSRAAISPLAIADERESSWTNGLLLADDMRFGDFIAELARYRNGVLRCDERAAELRINGAFRLDNTDAIIRALPATLPVEVSYLTRYWVSISYRES